MTLMVPGVTPTLVLTDRREPAYVGAALVIAAATLARLAFAASLGVGVDESYTIATARHLNLGYFDHPPLCWWLTRGELALFGTEHPFLLRLPFILLFTLSSGLLYRLTARLFSPAAGFWAVVAFTLAPVFGLTTASWILPDGPLLAALLGAVCCLVEATSPLSGTRWRWWIGAGLCAGLAMLSKFTALPVLAGAVVALATHPLQRRWLTRPPFWGALIAALTLFSPVLWWNAQHHWATFAFQGGRARALAWHPLAPVRILGGQALFLLPWIWGVLMVALASAWRRGPGSWAGWLLVWCATPTIALFALVGLWSSGRMLFHWADAGYLMLFPLAGERLAAWSAVQPRRLRQVAAGTAALITTAIAAIGGETYWGFLPLNHSRGSAGGDLGFTLADWSSLEPQMRARGWLDGKWAVASIHWHVAGRLDYVLGGFVRVVCLGDDPREYGLQHPASAEIGRDLLILAPGAKGGEIESKLGASFEHLNQAPPLYLLHGGHIAMEIPVYLGRGFKG